MTWIHYSNNNHQPSRRAQSKIAIDGVLLVDKPYACTSFDVIRRLKYQFGITKLGHAGTLDPLATGLLLVVLGKATKLSQALMCGIKEYTGIIQLGVKTTTYDREGDIIETQPVDGIDDTVIQETMHTFIGDQYQNPPMFSAKKHEGMPLYKLARKGKDIEREPSFIHISNFDNEGYQAPDISFRVCCSKGTYIRSLAYDLGEKIGCGAHLAALRRVRSGKFSIEKAAPLNALLENDSVDYLKQYIVPCHEIERFSL